MWKVFKTIFMCFLNQIFWDLHATVPGPHQWWRNMWIVPLGIVLLHISSVNSVSSWSHGGSKPGGLFLTIEFPICYEKIQLKSFRSFYNQRREFCFYHKKVLSAINGRIGRYHIKLKNFFLLFALPFLNINGSSFEKSVMENFCNFQTMFFLRSSYKK